MTGVWAAGKHVTIDDSMIKYMKRGITYIQYMPAKQINNGIKVFAIFGSLSTILLGFKVCVGQQDDSDNTALLISGELVKEDEIASARARTLYTDNYYM